MSLLHCLRPTLAVGLLLLAGCQSYPQRTSSAYADFQRGHLLQAVNTYSDTGRTGSAFLSGAEAGTVALAAGDWAGAEAMFGKSVEAIRELDRRAVLSLTSATEGLASWATNDTSREYFGEGFERVYVHANLALVYLALGNLDGVFVETRLANQLLEREEELYETEYGAGGLGHLLSAVSYELRGELDEALIDYRRMEAKGVGLPLVGRSLVRLAKELHFDDELDQLVEKYGSDYPRPVDAASIVVIGGVGLGPVKRESSLAIPTKDGFYSLAVPRYVNAGPGSPGLELQVGSTGVDLVEIEDVGEVARANLRDRLAWVATKSAARGLLKLGVTRELKDEHGGLGFLVGNLYSLFSERADLRAWQTLPDRWEAGRIFLEPGAHQLKLSIDGGTPVKLGTFQLAPNETMIVIARSVGESLYAYPIGGIELNDPAELLQAEAAAQP